MYAGKLVFAQVMEFAPWHTFRRLVAKHRGDRNVRSFSCLDQFLCMAFAQLTYRESLRDIEACLGAQPAKLYHLGIRGNLTRSNLADANEGRDWRIHCEFAQALIQIARRLYADEPLAVELDSTVYALDSTTIDLCLSLFPWAPFRETKAAVKLHTLLDLRGAIPTFIHISDGKLHDVNVLDILSPEPGAFYVMDRGYLDFERLYVLHRAGAFFVTRAKSNFKCRRIYSHPVDRSTGLTTPSDRLFFNVMASLAEMERGLTVERTRARLEVARQLGRKGGRKRRMTDSKIASAKNLLATGVPPRNVAKNLGVSVPTLYRWIPASAHA